MFFKVISKYFYKGSEIMVAGEGQLRSYEDKNGVKRKAYSVLVSDFDFCGSKSDRQVSSDPMPQFEEVEEEIPF